MSKWQFTWIVLLAGSLLLSACTARETTTASAPVQEADNQENGQVLTVVNPETAKTESSSEETAKKYQIQTRLTDFKLFSDTIGIAWGITRGELRLYTTKDKGRTWTNISPAATVQFPSAIRYGKEMYFLDQSHGWIMRKAQGSTEGILLYTKDGGLHWSISSLPSNADPSSIYFATPDRGWILSKGFSSSGSQSKTLYNSYDGGMTWSSDTKEASSTGADADGTLPGLPQYGYFEDMAYTTEQKGFTLVQQLTKPDLYTTSDGGEHWSANSSFFSKLDLENCSQYTAEEINVFPGNGQSAYIPVRCIKGDPSNSSKYSGYFTADGGKTFQFVDFALQWQSGENAALVPFFLNGQEGWSLQGNLIYHTDNQGKIWTALPESPKLTATLQDYPEVVKLQFITPEYGWILVQNSGEKTSRLLSTKDGGRSWQML
ncbi:hypothetical protein [Paenibacillus pinistramenti]|uniref:hypothetical protein n=1 Tax=Paenibacillus pinistramenti TaxID=1768003 RepID=UPI0011085AD9|nr:hypothetical protein [Paenibacillus pinistramenti]